MTKQQTTTPKMATKVAVLVDLRVELEPPPYLLRWPWCPSREREAEILESWARELEEFIRDHRSQDAVSISVERVVQEQCSVCGCPWEVAVDEDSEAPYCAGCGAEANNEVD